MKKKLSAKQLAAMRNDGAEVKVTKAVTKPTPIKTPTDRLLESQEAIAQRNVEVQSTATQALLAQIGNGNSLLAEKIAAITIPKPDAPKPVPYRFTIIRDGNGLIESVDAHPIED